ncbi:MAG: hypothetical protein QG604_863 [Candidatus Dependentiae bacterium]|nr:hypothetical protein [Candidatus Dependentiae bacterium]
MKNWILSLPTLLLAVPCAYSAAIAPESKDKYTTECRYTTASESIDVDDSNHHAITWNNIPPLLKKFLPGSENTMVLKIIGKHDLCVGEPYHINAHPAVTDIRDAGHTGRRKHSIIPAATIRNLEGIAYLDALLEAVKDAMTERSCTELFTTRFFTVTIEEMPYQLTLLSGYVRLEPFDDDFQDRVECGQILAENDTESYLACHLLARIGSIKTMLETNEIRFAKHFAATCCFCGNQNINQSLLAGARKNQSNGLSK